MIIEAKLHRENNWDSPSITFWADDTEVRTRVTIEAVEDLIVWGNKLDWKKEMSQALIEGVGNDLGRELTVDEQESLNTSFFNLLHEYSKGKFFE